MENVAYLALIEQNVKSSEVFRELLYEIYAQINRILESPHDYELRKITSSFIKDALNYYGFADYLKYLGFKLSEDKITYTKETLSNLRMAQFAIERKLKICCGTFDHSRVSSKSVLKLPVAKPPKILPSNILTTNNRFLLHIQDIFNSVLKYEDEDLQEYARQLIPVAKLQLLAMNRMREYQRKIKSGEIKGTDLPFDTALLMEMLSWFKYKFFTWVDKPACEKCGGPTVFVNRSSYSTETETCTVELYKCEKCGGGAKFPRYNDPRMLLKTRRGRCGEWANCFTLLCRAMRYDARYVYDTTDHVWCEVFDYTNSTWLHVDPCEGKLNAPLMYSCGWGKKLSYVIAASRDDIQDVTWRYTDNHKAALSRRKQCTEWELLETILLLREHRQSQVSEARRRYLIKRTLIELVDLMVERKPSDYESHGRISGDKEWRSQRGELGTGKGGHIFTFDLPGKYIISYSSPKDEYRIVTGDNEIERLTGWYSGVFHCDKLFRKVENDWRVSYLAREEGESSGSISWKITTKSPGSFTFLRLQVVSAVFSTGIIEWKVQFDGHEEVITKLQHGAADFLREFNQVTITAVLSGGSGDVAWQHAQLFRQKLDDGESAFDLVVSLQP